MQKKQHYKWPLKEGLDTHLTFHIWKKSRRWTGLGEAGHPGVHWVRGSDPFEELAHDIYLMKLCVFKKGGVLRCTSFYISLWWPKFLLIFCSLKKER